MAIAFEANLRPPNKPFEIIAGIAKHIANIHAFKTEWSSYPIIYWDISGYEYGCVCFSFGNDPSIFTIWNI